MSTISSTGSAYGTLSTYQLLNGTTQAQETSQTLAADAATGSVSSKDKDTDQAKVSQFGQLMSKMQQMSTTDQEAFKATAQTIADNLAQSASESTDTGQKAAFSFMAAKFAEAAETGDMSSLKDITAGPPANAEGGTTGSVSGGDTATISAEGKDLASQDGTSGNGASSGSDSSSDTGGTGQASASGSEENASGSSGAGAGDKTSGQAGAASAGGSSSSSSEDSAEDIEKQIEDLKEKIKEMEKKVQQAEQQAKTDDTKADKAKNLNAQLADLNSQLAQLETEKLEAESESAS